MASMPHGRLGPPPWSFAADAHDCIMVLVRLDRPHTSSWRDAARPWAGSPQIVAADPIRCAMAWPSPRLWPFRACGERGGRWRLDRESWVLSCPGPPRPAEMAVVRVGAFTREFSTSASKVAPHRLETAAERLSA